MPDITLTTLNKLKQSGEKFACLTAYDALFAHLESAAGVELLLIGDSLGMVLQGHDSTLPVTIEDMEYHTRAVKRGNQGALIMSDLPFMTCATLERALDASTRLMQAGAHVVKLEGAGWLAETISVLTRNGIPVCAHRGLTPQSVNVTGGYKVQGREQAQARELLADAIALAEAGAALLLLECVPSSLAAEITRSVSIPVIGIGAGPDTDGQMLVMHDMLGLSTSGRLAKFVRNFMPGQPDIPSAFSAYVKAVKAGEFPAPEHEF